MPKFTGWTGGRCNGSGDCTLTLLRHLVGRHPYVCPIMVTAYGDMKNIRAALNGGAVDFLTKPIDFADLNAVIDKAATMLIVKDVSAETRCQHREHTTTQNCAKRYR